MLNKLAERLRAVARVADVRGLPKPEKAKPDLVKSPLEKPAQISNKEPPKPPAKVSGQTPDKLASETHPVMRTSKALRAITRLHEWLADQNKRGCDLCAVSLFLWAINFGLDIAVHMKG